MSDEKPDPALTWREAEVLRLAAEGKSIREIGEELRFNLRAVRLHLARARRKTAASAPAASDEVARRAARGA